ERAPSGTSTADQRTRTAHSCRDTCDCLGRKLGRCVRATGPGTVVARTQSTATVARGCQGTCRALDPRSTGSGRVLGRYPASLGLLDDRVEHPWLRHRSPGDAPRTVRTGWIHGVGANPTGHGAQAGGLPVAGLV